ncbi:MAG: hypothetical protein ACOYOU_00220 [Kiritimatiellia bacterium]
MKYAGMGGRVWIDSRGARALCLTCLLGALVPAAQAGCGCWTWTGQGGDDNWSTPANWSSPDGPTPTNLYTTTLIFDGHSRLTPVQNIGESFSFGTLIFATNAGAFQLAGTTNVSGQEALRNLQFGGSNPGLFVYGGGEIVIKGAVITRENPTNNTIFVASNMTLQVPWIIGGANRVVVKKGSGTLRVYEHAENQYYDTDAMSCAPEYVVEDGAVEMGTRTGRYVCADAKSGGWSADPHQFKVYRRLTIGDALGGATTAVFRLIGPAQDEVMDVATNFIITVNSDGLLDFNGVQDWNVPEADGLHLMVSNGLVRLGNSSLQVSKAQTLNLRGSARIEGNQTNSCIFYDGATINVDGCNTTAVMLADADLHKVAGSPSGVVFHVSGHTGDVAALEVTGHLGAGGAGSHLIKRGPGTMVMGNLTHAVRTNRVEEGTLQINGLSRCGATASGSQWLVLTNATLGGSGIVSNATVVVQGGTLDPGGTSVGTLTVASNVTLATEAVLVFDLARAGAGGSHTNDQLVIENGVLTGLSVATLCIVAPDGLDVDGRQFRLIRGGGNLKGQMFRAVNFVGRAGRRADVTTGNGFVDIAIRNTLGATVMIVK